MYDNLISIHGEEPPPPQMDICTERQWAYLSDLAVKANRLVVPPRETLTKRDASELIESLKAEAAKRPGDGGGGFRVAYEVTEDDDGTSSRTGFVVLPAGDRVPAGRYAVPTPGEANEHGFFKLWIGDRGGWSLRRQLSDDFVPMERTQQLKVLARIASDPLGYSALFGQLIGACGVCGRTLTNDESRAIGIGPVCRERFRG
jgi:hypothetical protein